MSEDSDSPSIKVTDRRHFDKTGEKRPEAEIPPESSETGERTSRLAAERTPPEPGGGSRERAGPAPSKPGGGGARSPSGSPESSPPRGSAESSRPRPAAESGPSQPENPDRAPGDLSDIAAGLSSSFSLLVARLAQETEIYLGLVPYPGKETAEPDLEAARAMIDVLSMLQEKTRGNLDEQEAHLLENLLYTYRLEFVRRRSGGGAR